MSDPKIPSATRSAWLDTSHWRWRNRLVVTWAALAGLPYRLTLKGDNVILQQPQNQQSSMPSEASQETPT